MSSAKGYIRGEYPNVNTWSRAQLARKSSVRKPSLTDVLSTAIPHTVTDRHKSLQQSRSCLAGSSTRGGVLRLQGSKESPPRLHFCLQALLHCLSIAALAHWCIEEGEATGMLRNNGEESLELIACEDGRREGARGLDHMTFRAMRPVSQSRHGMTHGQRATRSWQTIIAVPANMHYGPVHLKMVEPICCAFSSVTSGFLTSIEYALSQLQVCSWDRCLLS